MTQWTHNQVEIPDGSGKKTCRSGCMACEILRLEGQVKRLTDACQTASSTSNKILSELSQLRKIKRGLDTLVAAMISPLLPESEYD